MNDGNHVHDRNNPQGLHKHKKLMVFGVIAIIIAIAAYDLGQTAIETTNINNVFEIVVNNTNLAPSIHGVPGTGERITGVTYYTNSSPIQIMVYAHAQNVSQTAFVELSINGTIVLPQSGRPLGGAEQSNRSISAIIPKYSNYSVIIENEHHYEWREYQILSGKNGTLSINQYITNITNTSVSDAQLNTKVNKSGDLMSGILNFGGNNFTNAGYGFVSHIIASRTARTPPVVKDDAMDSTISSSYLSQFTAENTSATSVFNTYSGVTGNQNVFSAIRYNGHISNYTGLGINTPIFFIGARGSTYNQTFSGSRASMVMASSQQWTNTSTGTHITFATTANNTTTRTNRMRIDEDGGVDIYGLAGIGNKPVYANPNGTLIRHNDVGNGTFDTLFVNKITKNDTTANNTIFIEGNLTATTAGFYFYNSNQNCFMFFNNEMTINCVNPNNPNQGTLLVVGNELLSLDYIDTTNNTHLELDTNGVRIVCGTTDAPENTGVACIR